MAFYKFPMPTLIDNWRHRHLIEDNFCPDCRNVDLNNGIVSKRRGVSDVYTFDYDILGGFPASSDYFLLGTAEGKIIEWDRNVNAPAFEDLWSGLDKDARWHFTSHYDSSSTNCQGTNQNGVVVGGNGVDLAKVYDPGAATVALRKVGNLHATITGRFPVSLSGYFYWAYMVDGGITYKYRVGLATIDKASDWTSYAFDNRMEEGDAITQMFRFRNQILITKGNQLWGLTPTLNVFPITAKAGLTNEDGFIANASQAFLNYHGKVITLSDAVEGSKGWFSQPIHNIFASAYPGSTDVSAAYDVFKENQWWGTGDKIFNYSETQGGWTGIYDMGRNIRLLSPVDPFDRDITSYSGEMGDHAVYSVAEEDIMPDFYGIYNGKTLVTSNHFSWDVHGSTRYPIKMEMYFRTDMMGDPDRMKRVEKIKMQGIPSRDYEIWTMATDYPLERGYSYAYQGTITTNSAGYGQLDVDILSAYLGIGVIEESEEYAGIAGLKVEYIARERLI